MDVPLYAIALVVFSVLYLAIGVFLAFSLIISLVVMFLYLTLRYHRMPDDYPHGLKDTMITTTFIGVTWGIFVFLAPKDPIPFIGNGLTYTNSAVLPVGAMITIGVALSLGFLVIWSFIAREMREAGGGGTGDTTSAESKPKQGVGA
ncbi:MAG: hypothetical protein ACREDK_00755 [Thermoplasmata archaeon]